jgi:SAM-dependent methyltransferase
VTGPLRRAWDEEAEAWAVWARAPGHDAFWHHTLPELAALLPAAGSLTLDLGSGEGRLARELRAAGHRVLGLDSSPTMARLAATHDEPTDAVVADLAHLPLRAGSADLAVACLSLQDVDDLGGAVRETARVLRAGGRFVLALVHPINSAGRFADPSPDAPFVITGSYLATFPYADRAERAGLAMTFHSMHRPLESYTRALEASGFVIEALREPCWLDAGGATRSEGWHRIPMLCLLSAVKRLRAPSAAPWARGSG